MYLKHVSKSVLKRRGRFGRYFGRVEPLRYSMTDVALHSTETSRPGYLELSVPFFKIVASHWKCSVKHCYERIQDFLLGVVNCRFVYSNFSSLPFLSHSSPPFPSLSFNFFMFPPPFSAFLPLPVFLHPYQGLPNPARGSGECQRFSDNPITKFASLRGGGQAYAVPARLNRLLLL